MKRSKRNTNRRKKRTVRIKEYCCLKVGGYLNYLVDVCGDCAVFVSRSEKSRTRTLAEIGQATGWDVDSLISRN